MNKLRIILSLLGLLAVAAGGYAASVYIPHGDRKRLGKRYIACIGDSITFGHGVARTRKRDAWTYVLERKLGDVWQVLNYGFSGTTAQDGGDLPYRRVGFLDDALESGAEIIILMLGTNDSKPYNWNKEGYEAAMKGLAAQIRRCCPDARLVLAVPPRAFPGEDGTVAFDIQNDIIRDCIRPFITDLAPKMSAGLVDLYGFTESHPEYFGDGVHPNVLGNSAIAGFLLERLGL